MSPFSWIGRRQSRVEIATPEPLERLAALLDHDPSPWPPGEIPPLAHWLFFLPRGRQSELDEDGHPRRGAFLPPSSQSRRMWAGGRIEFFEPVAIGMNITRNSVIKDVSVKNGSQGEMLLINIVHDILVENKCLIRETQNLIYLHAAPSNSSSTHLSPTLETKPFAHKRRHVASNVELFRFSALTFNSHRIHYDQAYARDVEHYPGLVVHGPYAAILLMDFFLQTFPGRRVRNFEFRAKKPLFANQPFDLHIDGAGTEYKLWICNNVGVETMSASLVAE